MKEICFVLISSIFLNTIFLDGAFSNYEEKFEIVVGANAPVEIASGNEIDEIYAIYAL